MISLGIVIPELPVREGFDDLVPKGLELDKDDEVLLDPGEVVLDPDNVVRPLRANHPEDAFELGDLTIPNHGAEENRGKS